MVRNLSVVFIVVLMNSIGCTGDTSREIERSVEQKLHQYPESTLQDLYKSYFQDYFGPGHLIANVDAARNYYDYELAMDDYIDTVLLDPTGYKGNFYRVNMVLMKSGTIPPDTFFNCFLESVNSVEGVSMEVWKAEWKEILSVIERVSPKLSGMEQDRQFLDSLLNAGEYVVHHSERYLEAYHPHYRIIHSSLFDEKLAKYLDQGSR